MDTTLRRQVTLLRAIRLGGVVAFDELVTRVDLSLDDCVAGVAELEATGHIQHRSGALTGWLTTSLGRDELSRHSQAELVQTGKHLAFRDAYESFRPINTMVLAVCSAWQVRSTDGADIVNAHDDDVYDAEVLVSLAGVHEQALVTIAQFAGILERFSDYAKRLVTAYDRIGQGETDWLCRPMIDSYHSVWFELHEDLLSTLGRTRNSEVGG